ncbi:hypothetical protein HY502_03955 [Candidatus Woesebacteria bacterium]|nr:hypothetical protein [Candidatus Woesebacteria bacterium]
MDIIKLFNFKDELPYISLIVFLFSVITIILFGVSPLICLYAIPCPDINLYIPDSILNFLFFLDIVFFLMVIVRIMDWFKQLAKHGKKKYVFDPKSWPSGWIFNGRPEVSGDELFVQRTRAGLLLEEKIWKNFKMSFEMKFDKDKYPREHVGIVFRARDLDNYYMLELRGEENGGIAPHIRYKSGWEMTEEVKMGESDKFDFSDFKKVRLQVVEGVAMLFYENKDVFHWILPTHADVNHYEAGVKDSNEHKNEDAVLLTKNLFGNHVQKIPFRISYGMVGFRAHYQNQGAIIRKLQIEPLS